MIRTSALLSTLCLLSAGFVSLGCEAPPHAVPADQHPASKYPRIVAQDGLDSDLRFSQPIEKQTLDRETGQELAPLSVTVPIRNIRGSRLVVQYRFRFLDETGAPMEPIMSWRRQDIAAEGLVYLKAAATDAGAVDWLLEIRKTR